MPIYAKKKEYETAPAGLHQAVCVDVVDLGLVDTGFGPQVKIKIVWQLAETNKKGYRFLVSQRYTPSLHKKSKLRPILESWRGKPFTAAEEKSFDIESVLGANCQLSITHNMTDEATYANVSAVVPAAKMAQKLFAENYEREVNRPDYVLPRQPEETEPEEDAQYQPDAEDEVPF
jgi:hypothetical protein